MLPTRSPECEPGNCEGRLPRSETSLSELEDRPDDRSPDAASMANADMSIDGLPKPSGCSERIERIASENPRALGR